MENLPEQFIFLDHVHAQSAPQSFEDNMNNINNNREFFSSTNGFSDSQDYVPTEIVIPFIFDNNVISRINFIDHQSQGLQNNHINNMNNMLLQNNSEQTNYKNNFDPNNRSPTQKTFLPQAEPQTQYNFSHQEINNLAFSPFSSVFGTVLDSHFPPSPNLMGMTTTATTLPLVSPLVSLGNSNFNRRPIPLYDEIEPHSPNEIQTNSLCSQKPPVYTKWTEEEDELLRAAINIYGPHKWSLIAAHVPNRTPMQCSTRWLGALNPTIHKGRWTPEEDSALKESVSEYADLLDSDGHPMPIPWNKIASRIPHRTGIQCQARWSEALDPSVRKGKWNPEEDEILKEGVRRYGRCWIRIAELIDGRTQRQCRTRWVQIKNKQAKIEREAMAAKASPTDDENENIELLTPPRTTPSTPAQTMSQSAMLQGLMKPASHIITKNNQSPSMSPAETSATDSCVTTPENLSSSPTFNKNLNPSYIYTYLPQ